MRYVIVLLILFLIAGIAIIRQWHQARQRRRSPCVAFTQLGEYGRLGNQLFQLAATQTIARMHDGATPTFPTSTKTLPLFQLFDLDHLHLQDVTPTRIVEEKGPTVYEPPLIPLQHDDVLDLRGYFQHMKYITHPLPSMRSMYRHIAQQYNGHVGVHVRRGDYVGLEHVFTPLPKTYYEDALDIVSRVSKTTRVIVCSDDIPWCKAHLIFDPTKYTVEFSENKTEIEDFAILAGCRGLVMSNSSYSWWAAQYGSKQSVVMPWPWFTPGGEMGDWNDIRALKVPLWRVQTIHM